MLGRVKNNHWFFWFKIDYNYSVAVCRHGGSELWESSRYKAISSKSTERGGALCSLDILMDERRYQTGAKRPLEEGFPSSSRRGRDATINGKQFRNCGVVGRNVRSRERASIVLERPGRHGLLGSLRQWGLLLFTNLVDSTCRVLHPPLLGFLVSEMTDIQNDDRSLLYVGAVAMLLNAVVKSQASHALSDSNFSDELLKPSIKSTERPPRSKHNQSTNFSPIRRLMFDLICIQ